MGSQHKGGVEFDYWTSNPWLNHVSLTIPKPTAAEAMASAAPCVASSNHGATHVSWFEHERNIVAAPVKPTKQASKHEPRHSSALNRDLFNK